MDKVFLDKLESLYRPNRNKKTQAYLFKQETKTISRNNTSKRSFLLWWRGEHWSYSSLSENECLDEYICRTSRENVHFSPPSERLFPFLSLKQFYLSLDAINESSFNQVEQRFLLMTIVQCMIAYVIRTDYCWRLYCIN